MSIHETHNITFTKLAKRKLQPDVIEENFAGLIGSVSTKSLKVRGWSIVSDGWSVEDHGEDATSTKPRYTYTARLVVNYIRADNREAEKHELPAIGRTLNVRASQPKYGVWSVATIDDEEYVMSDDGETLTTKDMVGYADVEIPDNFQSFFDHLYGLGSHVKRVRKAIEAAQASEWRNRYNVVLAGRPGCGKSDICQSLKKALGSDAVMEFDATATTAAGLQKELSEREILPRILVVEEIEKANEKALEPLMSICDMRGEIRKTTYRTSIQRDTKLLVIATVNNVPLFNRLLAGALSSRFPNKVFFKRPGRDLLARILAREVGRVNGEAEWIDPTLDYCEDHQIDDPRQVIAHCLTGAEDWLDITDGESAYVTMLKETESETEEVEELEL